MEHAVETSAWTSWVHADTAVDELIDVDETSGWVWLLLSCFVHLGVAVDSNALFYVLLLPTCLKQCLLWEPAGRSPRQRRCCGR